MSPQPDLTAASRRIPTTRSTTTPHIVTRCGRICFGNRKINLSTVFAGQTVGVKQIADQVWLVSFMDYDLGFFDNESCRVEPGPRIRSPRTQC